MLSPDHLQREIVTPSLKAVGLWSLAAERLVLGTAVQESGLKYLRQLKGPALGLWQVEPATHTDVWLNWLKYRTDVANAILDYASVRKGPNGVPAHDYLVFNLRYACLICRCLYRRIKSPLPDANDWPALANYWKAHYNSYLGAGKPEQFVAAAVNAGIASA